MLTPILGLPDRAVHGDVHPAKICHGKAVGMRSEIE